MLIDAETTATDYRKEIENYDVGQLKDEITKIFVLVTTIITARKDLGYSQERQAFNMLFDRGIELLIRGNILFEKVSELTDQEKENIDSETEVLSDCLINSPDGSLAEHLSVLVERNGVNIVSGEQVAQLYTEISKTAVKLDPYREKRGQKWVKIIFNIVQNNLTKQSQFIEARRILGQDGRFEELVKCVEHYRYDFLPQSYYTDILYAQEPGTYKNATHIDQLCTRLAGGKYDVLDRMISATARHFAMPESIETYFQYLTPQYIDQQSSNFITSLWAHLIAGTRVGKITLFQQTEKLINTSQPAQILQRASRVTHILSGLLLGKMYGHQEGITSPLTAKDLQTIKTIYLQVLQRIMTLSDNGYNPKGIKNAEFGYESFIRSDTQALIDSNIFNDEEQQLVAQTMTVLEDI